MAVGGTPWLFLLCLFLYHTAGEDQTIYITLIPRDYVDPRTAADFICGVEKTVDQDCLLAELNTPFIFDFVDKTEETEGYQSLVIDVVSFSQDGQAKRMLEWPQDEETALVSLFLVPPSLQCNSRTFEDAEVAGKGYYPVFMGTYNEMEEAVQKFEQAAVGLKPEYGGMFPKLCGIVSRMKSATASNRAIAMNLLFNFAFGKEGPHRALDLTDWKVCNTKEETTNAIMSSEIFDISSNIGFKGGRENEEKLVYVKESDGSVELVIVNWQVTLKKTVILVETEFSNHPKFAAADANDIVPFNAMAVFEANSKETSIFVRIKEDSKNETAEYFAVTLKPLKERTKRMVSTSGTMGVVITNALYNYYEFTDNKSYKWTPVWDALLRRPAFSILGVQDFDPTIGNVVPRPQGWCSNIYNSNMKKQIGDTTQGFGSVPTTNEYTNIGYHRGHLLSSEAIRTFLNRDPTSARALSISMLNIFPQNGNCNSGTTVAGTNTHPVWRQVESDTIKAGRDCIFGIGSVKTGNTFHIAHALVSSGFALRNIEFPHMILTNYCCVTTSQAIVQNRMVLTTNTANSLTCDKIDSDDPLYNVGDIWAAYLNLAGQHPFKVTEGNSGCIKNYQF